MIKVPIRDDLRVIGVPLRFINVQILSVVIHTVRLVRFHLRIFKVCQFHVSQVLLPIRVGSSFPVVLKVYDGRGYAEVQVWDPV